MLTGTFTFILHVMFMVICWIFIINWSHYSGFHGTPFTRQAQKTRKSKSCWRNSNMSWMALSVSGQPASFHVQRLNHYSTLLWLALLKRHDEPTLVLSEIGNRCLFTPSDDDNKLTLSGVACLQADVTIVSHGLGSVR